MTILDELEAAHYRTIGLMEQTIEVLKKGIVIRDKNIEKLHQELAEKDRLLLEAYRRETKTAQSADNDRISELLADIARTATG